MGREEELDGNIPGCRVGRQQTFLEVGGNSEPLRFREEGRQ